MSQFTVNVGGGHILAPETIPAARRVGAAGLMVATTNSGFAVAGIVKGGVGGSGMVQAVSSVARTRLSGSAGPPCVQFPLMVLPSPLRVPSNVPFNCMMETLTAEPLHVTLVVLMDVLQPKSI